MVLRLGDVLRPSHGISNAAVSAGTPMTPLQEGDIKWVRRGDAYKLCLCHGQMDSACVPGKKILKLRRVMTNDILKLGKMQRFLCTATSSGEMKIFCEGREVCAH
jgi:hypothetical protein